MTHNTVPDFPGGTKSKCPNLSIRAFALIRSADRSESVTLVTIGQVAAYAAAQCATQASTDGRTGLATQAVADDRTTSGTHATTDCSAGTVTFLGSNSATGCACYASTNGCTGAAAHALANNVTQRTAQTAADCGSAVASHRALSDQKTQNQSRQCETHDKNLKK
jgi:hypothetical protein